MPKAPAACAIATLLLAGCTHRPSPLALRAPSDNSYLDLKDGMHLLVISPITRTVGVAPAYQMTQQQGATITLSAKDLLGYRKSHYVVEGQAAVRLKFVRSEATRDGRSSLEASPPVPLFALPQHKAYLRLVYLIRASAADHNMALIAASNLNQLAEMTRRVQADPAACAAGSKSSCTWIPPGVAVRPET